MSLEYKRITARHLKKNEKLTDLFENRISREEETEEDLFHLLVHLPDDGNDKAVPGKRQDPGVPCGFFNMCGEGPSTSAMFHCFPLLSAGS